VNAAIIIPETKPIMAHIHGVSGFKFGILPPANFITNEVG